MKTGTKMATPQDGSCNTPKIDLETFELFKQVPEFLHRTG